MQAANNTFLSLFQRFLKKESASGILLMIAAISAIIIANTPLNSIYDDLLEVPVEVRVGALHIAKPLIFWINDGLMAIFFFLIGLELKRELIEGELSEAKKIVLPACAAIGGMLVPAIIYASFNLNDPAALRGWAIPAATDIAFALGILALFGKRVPIALKIFLVSLAIMDDMGAIVIIAIFYTSELSTASLIIAIASLIILAIFNQRNLRSLAPYIFVGTILWIAVLKSGVHATLAGVLLAFFIPLKSESKNERSLAKDLEQDLHGSVSYVIIPIFAFANAGVPLEGLSINTLLEPIPLGIILGLFFGKQIGIIFFSFIAVKLGIATLPDEINWKQLYGVALLCGIGFTMSLFIGSLAFEQGGTEATLMNDRLGILIGSTISAITGYLYLNKVLPK
ncbi:MAG: Na+/H+ antiporter NhaA [gamma proteobacterium symbiont of Bathyaustriella thionipta]|nr:Na+/H+ antiporter NhaA [gamma proteobacterium symbiont of Bathyaustriella thionipta]MCU7951224.1 Na+/H+ antiporter NhaA [gamma proteobacterium symbiont of Bathyaustriella thionipta]MCU7952702.1 Na+/H+ antiporter NhaA [gamma proteobacterium symbiont of Bathyaustriella thionipta]MCU7957745.1 Na+/H+ antiporter NhaA [gamma proteobacterium symbiont of Bathyaustriella thionipta]MCU7968053.1 Na+/H+ antiporter NhaA [gamma proteobacterium symbiont of Bathyaustriella thionipta]